MGLIDPATWLGDASPCDPDRAGDLSVVVQGGLSARNLIETANNVRHWRATFPAAQIVLALSGTDILEPEAPGRITDARLASPFRGDTQMRAALTLIRDGCDALVMAEGGVPLPPIKGDTQRPNNINLQIAAAKTGLAHATGRYVLRVRSDLAFLDRGFLDQYEVGAALPVGGAQVLSRRVLISWLYTLNPFTDERLPLHFSDWFNFGLRADVARLWAVPEMTLRDATYYRAHPHAAHSNAAERLFHTRLAVEQHVMFHGLGLEDDPNRLRYHNDLEYAARSIDLLIDNFVLCDMLAANCLFPKYGAEFHNHRKRVACITPGDWRALAAMRHVDPRLILSSRIQQSREPHHHDRRQGFPRHIQASALATEIGAVADGAVVAHGSGVVARGPRMPLPAARYLARVHVGSIEGPGRLRTSVVADDGATTLTEASIGSGPGPTDPVLPFEIGGSGTREVEVVCRSDGLNAVMILGLSIEKARPSPNDAPFPRIGTLHQVDEARREAGIAIPPGRYIVALDLPRAPGCGTRVLRVVLGDGTAAIASRILGEDEAETRGDELRFDVTAAGGVLLVCEGDGLPPAIDFIVAQRDWDCVAEPFPRFYDVHALRVANGAVRGDRIVSDGVDGVLCFGPYATLPGGQYTARVHIGGGRVQVLTVAITGGAGVHRITSGRFAPRRRPDETVVVPFEVPPDGMRDVEVVCSVRRPNGLSVTGVTLDRSGAGR